VSPQVIGALAVAVALAAVILAVSVPDAAARIHRHPDAADLQEAGWTHGFVGWELIRLALVAGAVAASITTGMPPAVGLLAAAAPSAWIRMRAGSARDRARRAVTRMVTGTEAALRSGATLPEALRHEADAATDPLARNAMLTALREFDLGASLDAALRSTAADLRDRRMSIAFETIALAVEERLPRERVAELLSGLADRLSFEERLDDEVRARASGARQQQKLLAVLVPAIALVLIASMPSLSAALDAPLGRFVLIPGAIAFELAGVVLARRIVNEALA
jgi:tight adherence protein B